jgi:hypothetical protein
MSSRILALCLAVLALSRTVAADVSTAPPPKPGADAICAAAACRKGGFDVALRTDSTHFTPIPVTHSPYVLPDGAILIFPGETVAIQFAVEDGKVGRGTFVRAFAPRYPMQITRDGQTAANPDDAALPVLKEGGPKDELAGLPPNTVVVSYGQRSGGIDMTLMMEQNMPAALKFDLTVTLPESGDYRQHAATSCPVGSNMMDDEGWGQPLGPILIANPRLLEPSATISCN